MKEFMVIWWILVSSPSGVHDRVEWRRVYPDSLCAVSVAERLMDNRRVDSVVIYAVEPVFEWKRPVVRLDSVFMPFLMGDTLYLPSKE